MTEKENSLLKWLESNTLRGIIFDFDGTLLDINDALERSIEEVLIENKIEFEMDPTLKEIGSVLESVQGYPLPKIILQSHEIFKYITTLSDLTFMKKLSIATEIFTKYLEYEKKAHLFPEVIPLLKELSKKVDLFILSHNQTQTIIEHLERENCKDFFKGIYGADQLSHLKPDPKALTPIINQYSPFHGDGFVMIGDMPTDIEFGREAGVWTIAIPSGISNKEQLSQYLPDLILENMHQLYELFGMKYKDISKSNEKEPLKIKS